MNRSLSWILAGAIALSGCAGPIETRVETHQLIAAPAQKNFILSAVDAAANPSTALARDLTIQSLGQKGYQPDQDAAIVVQVALSDRPADVAIKAGEKEAERFLAAAKEKKGFQSCDDREYRLTIDLFDQLRGTKLYSGSAAEYHCNHTMAQSVPFLVDSALSGLDSSVSETPQRATRIRQRSK